MKKIAKIITHEGIFHADDVFATALLLWAVEKEGLDIPQVVRVNHQTKATPEDGVVFLDVGGRLSPKDGLFDHHHLGRGDNGYGKATAGIILQYLLQEGVLSANMYLELKDIVEIIDLNDIGERRGEKWELPAIISSFNKTASDNDAAFMEAVDFCIEHFVVPAHKEALAVSFAASVLEQGIIVANGILEANILFEGVFASKWNSAIHSLEEYNDIDIVIWFDSEQNVWKAQTVPEKPESFQRRGRAIKFTDPLPEGFSFIHKGEFFAVADSKEALLNHLARC